MPPASAGAKLAPCPPSGKALSNVLSQNREVALAGGALQQALHGAERCDDVTVTGARRTAARHVRAGWQVEGREVFAAQVESGDAPDDEGQHEQQYEGEDDGIGGHGGGLTWADVGAMMPRTPGSVEKAHAGVEPLSLPCAPAARDDRTDSNRTQTRIERSTAPPATLVEIPPARLPAVPEAPVAAGAPPRGAHGIGRAAAGLRQRPRRRRGGARAGARRRADRPAGPRPWPALRLTRELLAQRIERPLFEATFERDGVLVRADILVPGARTAGRWPR